MPPFLNALYGSEEDCLVGCAPRLRAVPPFLNVGATYGLRGALGGPGIPAGLGFVRCMDLIECSNELFDICRACLDVLSICQVSIGMSRYSVEPMRRSILAAS